MHGRIKNNKILFILGFTNPFPGAAWARVSFFGNTLWKKGYHINVLGALTPSSIDKRGSRTNGNLRIFNCSFRLDSKQPAVFVVNALCSFIVSLFLLNVAKPNAVIVSMPPGDIGLGSILSCKLSKVKFFIDYRDEWEDFAFSKIRTSFDKKFYAFIRYFTRCLYANSQLITTVTTNCQRALNLRGLNRVKVIPNGADTEVFRPLSKRIADKKFQVLYSGGLGGYYRLDIAIQAIDLLVKKGFNKIELIIVGPGSYENLLFVSKSLGISSNVKYRGVMGGKTELANLIANCDVGLVPFDGNPLWKNALPAKFFEYCACGLPVIATVYNDSILSEIIAGNDIGLVSPPLDAIALSEAIRVLYENDVYRLEAGARASSLVLEKFNRAKLSEDFSELVVENL